MHIRIEKEKRLLTLWEEDRCLHAFPIALGSHPLGPKEREGDGKTPEGHYHVCLKKMGKYGPSLGVSYPNVRDACRFGADEHLLSLIRESERLCMRPPWGSPMGGEIYIHAGGTERDWTAGCIALEKQHALLLYELCPLGTAIDILP